MGYGSTSTSDGSDDLEIRFPDDNARLLGFSRLTSNADYLRLVGEDGAQLQIVGGQFPRSRPLNNDERRHVDRRGACQACHSGIPDQSLAISILNSLGRYTDHQHGSPDGHNSLLNSILLVASWAEIIALPLMLAFGVVLFLLFRKRRAKSNVVKGGSKC